MSRTSPSTPYNARDISIHWICPLDPVAGRHPVRQPHTAVHGESKALSHFCRMWHGLCVIYIYSCSSHQAESLEPRTVSKLRKRFCFLNIHLASILTRRQLCRSTKGLYFCLYLTKRDIKYPQCFAGKSLVPLIMIFSNCTDHISSFCACLRSKVTKEDLLCLLVVDEMMT